jgi:hypothetical protein
MRVIFIALLLLLIAASPPSGADRLGPSLAEIRAFAASAGDRLWPGYGTAPFGFLLLEPKEEILLCRDAPPVGFVARGREPATGCAKFARPRTGLPGTLLAAMPLFGPPSTIVMGTAETTGKSEADWLRTILHEHFHQWQASLPGYYARLDALDLKDGDVTGMWALNFPFPYGEERIARRHAIASAALASALEARGTPRLSAAFEQYLTARRAFADAAGDRNWRYAELQLWQEGVARWTEIVLGRLYPDPAVREAAAQLETRSIAKLRFPDLAADKREFVYAHGAGEAMLLEACLPEWRARYAERMALAHLLEEARKACARVA